MPQARELAERVSEIAERMYLNEMALLASRKRGAPYDFVINGDPEHYPPHIHIVENGKLITRLVVPHTNQELTLDDLFFLKGEGRFTESSPDKFKRKILSVLNSMDEAVGLPLWRGLYSCGIVFSRNCPIKASTGILFLNTY